MKEGINLAFDGFTLKAIVNELNSCIIGGRIEKIHQPTSEEIVLSIYSQGINYALSINTSFSFYSLHLTTNLKSNPLSSPNFCMLLRKYLIGSRIKKINMMGLERIAIFEIEKYFEHGVLTTLKLIVELMGKHSNIILAGQDNNIIDSLRHLNSENGSYRNIFPKAIYELPESNKFNIIEIENIEELYNNLNKNQSLSTYFLENFTGTSKTLLEHSMQKLEIDEDFSSENFQNLFLYLRKLLEKIENNMAFCIELDKDYSLEFSDKVQESLSINFFLDDYYFKKEQNENFIQYRNNLLAFVSKNLKKISKKLDGVNSKIDECSEMEKYKLYGELITSNLYKLDKTHKDYIVLQNYYDNNREINIPLDISLSPADNAKKYFKKYNKLKNTIDIVSIQKNELENEINYLESIVYSLQIAKNVQDIDKIYEEMESANFFARKTQVNKNSKVFKISGKLKYKNNKVKTKNDFLSYNIDGFNVLVGRNNMENDYLTTKIANDNDIWFHVKDLQGSHVILVVAQKEPSQETINKVAELSAYYSKAKQSSNVPVDYTFAKYVKKPSKSKPGIVIYTNQKTVNVNPKIY